LHIARGWMMRPQPPGVLLGCKCLGSIAPGSTPPQRYVLLLHFGHSCDGRWKGWHCSLIGIGLAERIHPLSSRVYQCVHHASELAFDLPDHLFEDPGPPCPSWHSTCLTFHPRILTLLFELAFNLPDHEVWVRVLK